MSCQLSAIIGGLTGDCYNTDSGAFTVDILNGAPGYTVNWINCKTLIITNSNSLIFNRWFRINNNSIIRSSSQTSSTTSSSCGSTIYYIYWCIILINPLKTELLLALNRDSNGLNHQ